MAISLPTHASFSRMTVRQDRQLVSLAMDCYDRMGYEEAKEVAARLTALLAPPSEDFEVFAQESIRNQRSFGEQIFASRTFTDGDTRISVGWNMIPGMFLEKPFRLSITILWERPTYDRFAPEPLSPPEGYAHYSIERPAILGGSPSGNPDFQSISYPIEKASTAIPHRKSNAHEPPLSRAATIIGLFVVLPIVSLLLGILSISYCIRKMRSQ